MKRLRLASWGEPLLQNRRIGFAGPLPRSFLSGARFQSTAEATAPPPNGDDALGAHAAPRQPLPSPPPERALRSAKLAALHARLSLPQKIHLQTLARTLITPSADPSPSFNNMSLAFLGATIINYHVLEYLVCKWPRLPMAILYELLRAYSGQESLYRIGCRWGVEAAAAPGEEVDPGLLQWSPQGEQMTSRRWGYVRSETERKAHWRRGISSRVVWDDDFGDALDDINELSADHEREQQFALEAAYASFVHAAVGALYAHCGREASKSFVTSHILSRQIDPSTLFAFKLPTRELAMLCAREGFEPPLARLESETGRLSRTPVFIVGIYSGKDKLAEGAGPSLDMARRKACMVALKAWYLYSPGNKVRVPSDMMEEGAEPWKAPYIDIGEII